MKQAVGVRFRNVGKNYFYEVGELEIKMNDTVIAETPRGVEIGVVSLPVTEMDDEKLKSSPGKILRVATDEDKEKQADTVEKEKEAYRIGKEKIAEHGLDMKLVQTEYLFDRNKLIFYFTAEERVDFRELVKTLASVFRTRIELRQIGVRDETGILGGIGICGRELCCKAYLTDFAPVSMKMAKEQSLSLNPTKISGVCGRLMCCLKNEEDVYEYLNKTMPSRGDTAVTSEGESGLIIDMNILKQTVRVLFEQNDEREVREYSVDELTFEKRKKGEPRDGGRSKREKSKPDAAQDEKKGDNRDNRNDNHDNRGDNHDNRNRRNRRGGQRSNDNRNAQGNGQS